MPEIPRGNRPLSPFMIGPYYRLQWTSATSLLTRITGNALIVAVVLTILVGASRVYLGVHYPSDVIAGWCLGSAWALLCWGATLWLQARGKVEPPAAVPTPKAQ